jgi:hypothetical protein
VSDVSDQEGREPTPPDSGSDRDDSARDQAGSTEPRTAEDRDGGRAWLGAARLLAPVLLATAAVGAHFRINVPDAETLAAARAQRKPAPKQKPAPKPKTPVETKAFEARTDAQLARSVRRFESVDFEEEPIIAAWARRHQNLVSKAVVVARKHAFEGAPEEPRVIVTGTRCRTVRCRFVLRSPYPHELDLLDRALASLHVADAPLWRTYASEPIDPPPGAPPGDAYLQVTVAFTSDEPDARSIEVPSASTAETGSAD